ncbi:unnamed protein product [Cunninghamella blakesleeana]
MDLKSLLNQGGSGLSTNDLIALQSCDSNEKLEKISTAVFEYPSDSFESYRFFDVFIKLVLSIQDGDDIFGLEYTNSVIITALKSCIGGLLKLHGFNWLLDYPSHLSYLTWKSLQTKTNHSLLIHLYGLSLGLKKNDTVPKISWAKALLHFLRAEVPPLSCHIWLNFCFIDQQQGKKTNHADETNLLKDLFLTSSYINQDQLVAVLEILNKGNANEYVRAFENQLGTTLLRDSFTHDEMVLAMMTFEKCVKSNGVIYPEPTRSFYVYNHQKFINEKAKSKLIQSNYINPFSPKSLLSDLPSDFSNRSKEIEKGIQLWLQQIGKLQPSESNLYLKELILNNYPSDKKRVLDMVIIEWAIFDPFDCHMEVIINTMISLVGSSSYNKRSAPYYAWIQSFNLTSEDEGEGGNAKKSIGYNIKTGAEIKISRFNNSKHDLTRTRGLEKILQKLTYASSTGTKLWIEDCLRMASSGIIEEHIAWLTKQLNHELENITSPNASTPFMSHLQFALMNPRVISLAPFIVPILLHNASDQLLAWLVKKRTEKVTTTAAGAGKILIEYFSEGNQLSSKILITDLLRTRSKGYIDYLMGYLRINMESTDPSANNSRLWFDHHFLMPILLESGNELIKKNYHQKQQQYNVSLLLYQQLLSTPDDFNWFFKTPCANNMNISSIASKHTWINDYHLILPIRNIGLESLLQCMVQLDTFKQQQFVNIWKNLWLSKKEPNNTSTIGADDNKNNDHHNLSFNVPIDWILQCIGLYDQAPAIVKQMIELFITIGIKSRIHQNQIVVDTIGKAETFTQQMMDLFLLSDTSEVDGLFDLYLRLCQDVEETRHLDESEMVRSTATILISLTEELKLRTKYTGKSSSASDKKDVTAMEVDNELENENSTTSDDYENTTDTDNEAVNKLDANANATTNKNNSNNSKRQPRKQRQLEQYLKWKNKFNYKRKRKQKKLQQKLLKQKKNEVQSMNVLFILVQRALNFLFAILSGSDENSLCPNARQKVRNDLIHCFTLYEPLANLKRMDLLPTSIQDDLQLIIDVCLELLSKNDSKIYNIVKHIFAM